MENFKSELTSFEQAVIGAALDNFLETQRTAPIDEKPISENSFEHLVFLTTKNPKLLKTVENLLKKWDATFLQHKTVKITPYK